MSSAWASILNLAVPLSVVAGGLAFLFVLYRWILPLFGVKT